MSETLHYDKDCFLEYEKVAREVHKDLYIFLYSMCEDNYIVKDAVRNALIKGYKSFHIFKNIQDFKIWMFRMGKLEIKDILEKDHKLNLTNSRSRVDKGQEKQQDQQENLLKKDTIIMILKATESLDIDLREIIILKYYYNLSYEKIAEIQGVDVNTIESKYVSAKWKIKDYLCEAFNISGGEIL